MRQRQTIDFDYLFTSIVVDTIFLGGGKNPDVVRMEYSDVGSPPLFPSVLFFFFFCFDVESNSNRSSSSSHLRSWDLYLRLLGALYLFLNFSHTKTLLMCQKILSWPLEREMASCFSLVIHEAERAKSFPRRRD